MKGVVLARVAGTLPVCESQTGEEEGLKTEGDQRCIESFPLSDGAGRLTWVGGKRESTWMRLG